MGRLYNIPISRPDLLDSAAQKRDNNCVESSVGTRSQRTRTRANFYRKQSPRCDERQLRRLSLTVLAVQIPQQHCPPLICLGRLSRIPHACFKPSERLGTQYQEPIHRLFLADYDS